MVSIKRTKEIPLNSQDFVNRVLTRINNYSLENNSSLYNLPPFIDYSAISIKDDTLIVRKSGKPFDKFTSPFSGYSGLIAAEIIESQEKTILDSTLQLDTTLFGFIKYLMATMIALSGIVFLIYNPSWVTILVIVFAEGLIFGLPKIAEENYLSSLEDYYVAFLDDVMKE